MLLGGGQELKAYFTHSLQWIRSETHYIPDVYHTVLIFLILLALSTTLVYLRRKKTENTA